MIKIVSCKAYGTSWSDYEAIAEVVCRCGAKLTICRLGGTPERAKELATYAAAADAVQAGWTVGNLGKLALCGRCEQLCDLCEKGER